MQIQVDTREKDRAIKKILYEFKRQNIKVIPWSLYVGDYQNWDNPRLIIDRKRNLSEIYSNLCHGKKRFAAELQRAMDNDIKLIILCEHGYNIQSFEDVKNWDNPRLKHTPYAWNGDKLYREMKIIEAKYNTQFLFCTKAETGKKIIEILSGTYEQPN